MHDIPRPLLQPWTSSSKKHAALFMDDYICEFMDELSSAHEPQIYTSLKRKINIHTYNKYFHSYREKCLHNQSLKLGVCRQLLLRQSLSPKFTVLRGMNKIYRKLLTRETLFCRTAPVVHEKTQKNLTENKLLHVYATRRATRLRIRINTKFHITVRQTLHF
jgi:hypothetical protein